MKKRFLLLSACLFAAPLFAQVGAEPLPARGSSMDAVKRQLGEPRNILGAVGDPPITRWVYPDYIVYFEHSHVITTVSTALSAPQSPPEKAMAMPQSEMENSAP